MALDVETPENHQPSRIEGCHASSSGKRRRLGQKTSTGTQPTTVFASTSPTVPDDWQKRDTTESLDSSMISLIDSELQDLGRAVDGTLEDYLERDEEASDHG